MRIDNRRPRHQVTRWQRGEDEYRIALEQIGHHGWQLTQHRGIEMVVAVIFEDPDEAQEAYIQAQRDYLNLLAEFTLAPLPRKPSEIISFVQDDGGE